ncbi:MAG: hypothetical protein KJ726_09520 [Verrucomicrobia bacterium]|nr:hypothetical protein [Verrucomicrobiota bacterium]MBU1910273.1 hypothetical protein [Verrucomicrobiota bacterium]
MEKGAKIMARMLLIACLLGLGVILFNPDYRQLFHLIRKGTPAEAAIWQSNLKYYPAVGATPEEDPRAK